MKKPKIDDKGFSVPLALTDMIPVLFLDFLPYGSGNCFPAHFL